MTAGPVRLVDTAHEGPVRLSAGRQGVFDATADLGAAKAALAAAEAAYELAVETAKAADARRQAQDEADQAAAADLAKRIKTAAATGDNLKVALPPSLKAVARGDAQAEADAAHLAVNILAAELEAARAGLDTAMEDVGLATMAVVAEVAEDVVEQMTAALAKLESGHFKLVALESTGFTLTSAGMQRLNFTNEGRRFIRWELAPRMRAGNAARALAEKWRAWRDALAADPTAPAPDDVE
jgi:hypothetical protein